MQMTNNPNPILFHIWVRRKQGDKHSDLNWEFLRREYNYCEEVISSTCSVDPNTDSCSNSNPSAPPIKE